MKKVLVVITTSFEPTGGLATVMMNYYRAMDKTGLSIDFASTNFAEDSLITELQDHHSHYFCLGDRKKHPIGYMIRLGRLLNRQKYDLIHINGNSSTMLMETSVAKRNGIKEIICHVHTAQSEYPLINRTLRPIFRNTYTKALAVSEKAGKWLFREGFEVLNNAIDLERYQFNPLVRGKLRHELNLEDQYVIGTVGKLTEAKNQSFLLEVFAEYHKINSRSTLVVAGGGDLEEELKQKAKDLKIYENVMFLGMRNDINEILQCYDAFVFTSLYEGFGMVLVEAQAAGLFCISSDTVPMETKVSQQIKYISLRRPVSEWVQELSNLSKQGEDRMQKSINACKSIAAHGFDIRVEAKKLTMIYQENK